MLSATPTDMGHSLRRTCVMRERKTDPALHPVSAERELGTNPVSQTAASYGNRKKTAPGIPGRKKTAWLREVKPGRMQSRIDCRRCGEIEKQVCIDAEFPKSVAGREPKRKPITSFDVIGCWLRL